MLRYYCGSCDEVHDGIPVIEFHYPDYAEAIPEAEWPGRVRMDGELAQVDEFYFVRVELNLPIIDYGDELFTFAVWGSVSEESYQAIQRYRDEEADFPGCFAWLNNLPGEFDNGTVIDLGADLHVLEEGGFEMLLHDADHPLVQAQRNGITMEQVLAVMHGNGMAEA